MSDESSMGVLGSITKGEEVKSAYAEQLAEKKANPKLDKEAFLNLLMAQLKYQDPMDPMDNTQMVAQLAQFSSLEQMTNLSTTMTNTSAYGLIGKYVIAEHTDSVTSETSVVEGVVDSVILQNGKAQLVIGDETVDYDNVRKVLENTTSTDYTQSMNGNMVNAQAIDLVGKTVQAVTADEDGNADEYIEGKVDYVTFVDEVPVLHIGGKEVSFNDVMTVGSGELIVGNSIVYENAEGEEVEGTISNIEIENDKVYVTVDGQNIQIADLSSLMTAFSLIGKNVDLDEVAGEISGVCIRDTVPYVKVGDSAVKYSIAAESAV